MAIIFKEDIPHQSERFCVVLVPASDVLCVPPSEAYA